MSNIFILIRHRVTVQDTLLEGKGGAGEWTRKYFVIDDGTLTFHASHSSIVVVQGAFKLPPTTQVGVCEGEGGCVFLAMVESMHKVFSVMGSLFQMRVLNL